MGSKKITKFKIASPIDHLEIEWKGLLLRAGLFSLFFIALETAFSVMQGFAFSGRFFLAVAFSVAEGFVLASLTSFLPRTAAVILNGIFMLAADIWAVVQVCYYGRFLNHMEISKIGLGRQAAEEFGDDFRSAVTDKIPQIIVLFLIFVVFFSLTAIFYSTSRKHMITALTGLVAGLIIGFGTVGGLAFFEGGNHGLYATYKAYPGVLDSNMVNFGLITSLRLDLRDTIAGAIGLEREARFEDTDQGALAVTVFTPTPTFTPSPTPTDVPVEKGATPTFTPSPTPTETPTPTPRPRTLEIDFDKVLSKKNNSAVASLNKYVQNQKGSFTNEYTGMFEGKNLILICAESFSGKMINETLTPTLYKMSHNGFVFKNYYGTFKAVTTNGEYAFLTGLLPNTVGTNVELKTNTTFELSANRYMPYTLANFLGTLGVKSYGYHGNNGSYYNRNLTHPNIGYHYIRFRDYSLIDGVQDKKGELHYTKTGRPTSDYETAKQTLDDYLSQRDENGKVKQFSAYYMTYSGHHPYYDIHATTDSKGIKLVHNPMCFTHRDIVDGLKCSEGIKSYIACNLEVEDMVTEIIDRLTEAGCLEDTVIVLTNDHYPYGFSSFTNYKKFAEVCGNPITDDTFGCYENSFICYCAGMEEPVIVDAPCCTVDIVPTLLNLFGAEYDSRLLAGTDVLDPQSFHVAMIYDKSFVTDRIKYDAVSGKVTYLVDKSLVPKEYVDACISYVLNKFEVSLQIVGNDYYRLAFGD